MTTMSLKFLINLALLLSFTLSNQVHAVQLTVRQVFQFPNSSVENIAIRPNGQLLLSIITSPVLYLLDVTDGNPSPQPQLIHRFDNVTSCLGIAQTSPDVYAIIVGNVTTRTYMGTKGTFAVWSVDLNTPTPLVKKIASIPEAQILNGMTIVQQNSHILLLADSAQGAIYSLNIDTKVYKMVMQSPYFTPTSAFPLGINGIRTFKQTLYFTNSIRGFFGSIPIDSQGFPTANVSIIANNTSPNTYDDFAIDQRGQAWVSNHGTSLSEITPGGVQTTVLNSTGIGQPTSAVFSPGGNILYLSTGGAMVVNSTARSGQVLEVRGFCN